MRKFSVVAAFLALAACEVEPTVAEMSYTEQVALVEVLRQDCEAQGVKRDTPEMKSCLQVEAVRETARREKAAEDRALIGAALGAGMTGYANAMPTYQPPVRCYSNTLGSTVNTTCY